MVEANARGVSGRAPHGFDEGFVAGAAQFPWVEGRQAPVLAVRKELVGRRAHAHVRGEQVLPAPRVEAVGGEADRHVRDEADLARSARQLPVEVELLPDVKCDAPSEPAAFGVESLAAGMS